MDSWTSDQIVLMKAGGNKQCLDYLSRRGIDSSKSIRERYDNNVASEYKTQLKAKLAGKPNSIDKSGNKITRKRTSSKTNLFNGAKTAPIILSPAEEAHNITVSLLRTKHLMEQNLERTNEASSVLQSDERALREAKDGQEELGSTVKGASSALRALKRQDAKERFYLLCAIGFYCGVIIYIVWTRIRIPFLTL